MTDHNAEAVRLLAMNAPEAEQRAQTHAMLALAEQQRITNLIAFLNLDGGRTLSDSEASLQENIVVALKLRDLP